MSGRRGWRLYLLLLPHWLLLGSSVLLARACDHHHEEHDVRGGHQHSHQHGSIGLRRSLQEDPEQPEVCGTEDPTPNEAQAEEAQVEEWQQLEGRQYLPPRSYSIPLYFHVIQNEDTPQDKEITVWRVLEYIDYLNNAFRESVFYFQAKGWSRTKNTEWANGGRVESIELDFKRSLKRGGMETLNIYLVNTLPPPPGETRFLANWVGFAYLPSSNAATGAKDGVVVTRSQAVPGNDQRPNTLVHEVVRAGVRAYGLCVCLWNQKILCSCAHASHTHSHTTTTKTRVCLLASSSQINKNQQQQQQGHWLGLLHTFAGGCNANHNGDLVDDTPAHVAGGQVCDDVCCFGDLWDSCPNLPGIDPVE